MPKAFAILSLIVGLCLLLVFGLDLGIKFPFKILFSWLDGRDSFQINDIKTNVDIDNARFGRP